MSADDETSIHYTVRMYSLQQDTDMKATCYCPSRFDGPAMRLSLKQRVYTKDYIQYLSLSDVKSGCDITSGRMHTLK